MRGLIKRAQDVGPSPTVYTFDLLHAVVAELDAMTGSDIHLQRTTSRV